MNLNPQFFSSFWIMVGALLYAWVLIMAIKSAAWWRLRNAKDINVLLYVMLGVFFMWQMNTNFEGSQSLVGPTLHLLGATLMTMMFGWAFAILALSIVLLAFTILTTPLAIDSFYTFSWVALATCVLPVLVNYRVFRFVDTRLPNNFFIYIFVCAFFNAALAIASVVMATASIQYLSGAYSFDKLSYGYIPYGMIMMFPEAFLTGMLMSIFVVYHPEWVSTFDDNRYLRKQK